MIKITRSQFDVLVYLEAHKKGREQTQRQIARGTALAIGTVNTALTQLNEEGYAQGNAITDAGIDALEPHRARRAVFLAADFTPRLVPITLNTPEPLIRVKGVRIIDTLLNAVLAAGIEDIVVVRGYHAAQFDELLEKYPQIRFLENPDYNESNTITSALQAKDLLGASYVFNADLLLYNPALITKYQYATNILGAPVGYTDSWCFESRNRMITRLSLGGVNCHYMFGLSWWSLRNGEKLARHIEKAYRMPGGKELFFEQVPLEVFAKDYRVEVRECAFESIARIETYRQLKKLDSIYG